MRTIVVSESSEFDGEIETIHELFDAGLDNFHIRKPKMSTKGMERFLRKIDAQYRDRIVIHSHHELCVKSKIGGIHLTQRHRKKNVLSNWIKMKWVKYKRPDIRISTSFHNISSVLRFDAQYSYVFLSPIFESISKVGYRNTFNEESLRDALQKTSYEVIAMGGVNIDKIDKVKDFGFKGFALLGGLWQTENPVETFKKIKAKCQQIEVTQ